MRYYAAILICVCISDREVIKKIITKTVTKLC